MSVKGPVLIIEDDLNDLDVIKMALKENGVENELIVFEGAKPALEFLMMTTEMPFLILCDIRLREMNGLSFRSEINKNEILRKKSIPFIYLTGAVSQGIVDEAYDLTVQGFFKKPGSYAALREQMQSIVNYWEGCLHPNSF